MNFKSLAQQNDTVSNSFYCKGHKKKVFRNKGKNKTALISKQT